MCLLLSDFENREKRKFTWIKRRFPPYYFAFLVCNSIKNEVKCLKFWKPLSSEKCIFVTSANFLIAAENWTRLESYNDPRLTTNQSTRLKNGLTLWSVCFVRTYFTYIHTDGRTDGHHHQKLWTTFQACDLVGAWAWINYALFRQILIFIDVSNVASISWIFSCSQGILGHILELLFSLLEINVIPLAIQPGLAVSFIANCSYSSHPTAAMHINVQEVETWWGN